MGNIIPFRRQNRRGFNSSSGGGGTSSTRTSTSTSTSTVGVGAQLGGRRRTTSLNRPIMSSEETAKQQPSSSFPPVSQQTSTTSITSSTAVNKNKNKKKKYDFIPDNYYTLDQVTAALRESGLESSNLIIGIDFTKSNEWTGKISFNNRSLHKIGDIPNPYEKAISIIGKTLAPFDEDNLIPCFGFGDSTTHDQEVFSFHNDHSPCHGFEEVLSCYKQIVPNLRLSGPTSYAPVVEAAVDIVEKSGGQYHVLVIIADGQVTRSVNTGDEELSPQEEKTINSIVNASNYPLSIVLVGVGDGPWEDMKKFDDKVPDREFDNFQFVNFTAIMSKDATPSEKETAFALAALMEIPIQYKAAIELGLLGRVTGKAKKVVPRPPPVPYTPRPSRERSNLSTPVVDEQNQVCPICLTNVKDMAFGCGHTTCRECGSRVSNCPICRQQITSRLRLYTG
ncbi:E3 ubiquitin-protein ligase RGLG4-like isoform X1 [Camellia sinensis]|uniref:E3 ubiquitin-protein ligase RGLG4-like isoform X1 n=1 Tax=Camellia sinensis TaxID=4442 RepID=UPI001035A387|nr:E3 ubiquitin-protein ligase RGLG4-like isoform X1 [Camellia sinensis]